MYLRRVTIKNYRQFEDLQLDFSNGLNLLVGENDSGKSSILEAIKLVTGTHSNDLSRLSLDDFYTDGTTRATELKITCYFVDLSTSEAAAFLEWLSLKDTRYYLKLTLTAQIKPKTEVSSEINFDIRAGEDEESGLLASEARNKLKVTFLKALRDAEYELAPRKGSRLSQILSGYDIFNNAPAHLHPLVEVMDKANDEVKEYFEKKDGKQVSDTINKSYLEQFSLLSNPLSSKFEISKNELSRILEKLELRGVSKHMDSNLGLGSNNLIFIAAELLLLKRDVNYVGLKLSLIEEIEAHLHPQLQLNLIDFINKQSGENSFQSIITTHSNTLSSKIDIDKLILCRGGKAFPLAEGKTQLARDDYYFLSRFLDDTKANLFFANGVIIVEGDAENLLIPTLAEIIGLPLHKYGVSVVNVGSTALMRYAKIFQRADGVSMGIRISCVTDRDIPPKEARDYEYDVKSRTTGNIEKRSLLSASRKTEDQYTAQELTDIITERVNKYKGGDIDVFIPGTWTLEYEIAKSCLRDIFHLAVKTALLTADLSKPVTLQKKKAIITSCNKDWEVWNKNKNSDTEIAVAIFAPLERKQVSKAVVAQVFSLLLRKLELPDGIDTDPNLKYIVDAIKHACHV